MNNMIDKDIMKDRVKVYGNNFPAFADMLSEYLSKEITPQDAAKILAFLKLARVQFTEMKLSLTQQGTEEYMKLLKHRDDSVTDYNNYTWIADNYEEYKELTE